LELELTGSGAEKVEETGEMGREEGAERSSRSCSRSKSTGYDIERLGICVGEAAMETIGMSGAVDRSGVGSIAGVAGNDRRVD